MIPLSQSGWDGNIDIPGGAERQDVRWSRLFGQFSAIPKWKSLFSVWPPGGSGGRLKFTGSAMLPSFPYRLTGRVSLSQADCSR
jgi:hypothetical protein